MSDKLINIDYKNLDAYTTASDPQVKLAAEIPRVDYETSVTVPVKNTDEVTYLDKLTVVVTGAGETSIPQTEKFKRLQDRVQNLQDSLRKTPRLAKVSPVDVSDTVTKRPRKQLVELLDPQSLVRFTSRRASLDTADVGDSVTKRAGKPTTELLAVLDAKTLRVQKSAFSLVADSDIARLLITKPLATLADVSDLFNTTAIYNRSFAHSVDATDDFYGAGNVDDDQVARVTKVLINWVSSTESSSVLARIAKNTTTDASDVLATKSTKQLLTQFQESDQTSLRTQKIASDSTRRTDLLVARTSKSLSTPAVLNTIEYLALSKALAPENTALFDQKLVLQNKLLVTVSNAAEVLQNSIAKPFANTVLEQDISTLIAEKVLNTTYTKTDQVFLNPIKQLNSVIGSLDVPITVTAFNRSFAHAVDATDDFFGLGNIDDDQTARIGKTLITSVVLQQQASKRISKPLQDSFVRQDLAYFNLIKSASDTTISSELLSFFKFANRFFNELIATSSSGFINNQSYFAGNYVTPGYVGTNTYFS